MRKRTQTQSGPRDIDEYLASIGAEQRATLEQLRRDIRSAAPEAEECISYRIPSFRLHGRFLFSFGAARRHCAFYPGAHPIEALAAELEGFELSRGTIRFPIDQPLPKALVRKLVRARIAERGEKPKTSRRSRAKSGR